MKIYITGPAWSGKSTISLQLAQYYDIPVIHLDDLLWNADWTENLDYKKLQQEALSWPDWIIEWPSCSIVRSMQGVDKIIILNYPPIGNICRIIKRYLKASILGDLRVGMRLPERFNMSLLYRTFIWRKQQLPRLLLNIEITGLYANTQILTSPQSAFELITA
jgi:adenylate kinase family enzyme